MAHSKPSTVVLSLPDNESTTTIANTIKEVVLPSTSETDKTNTLDKLRTKMTPLLLYVVSTAQFLDVGKFKLGFARWPNGDTNVVIYPL